MAEEKTEITEGYLNGIVMPEAKSNKPAILKIEDKYGKEGEFATWEKDHVNRAREWIDKNDSNRVKIKFNVAMFKGKPSYTLLAIDRLEPGEKVVKEVCNTISPTMPVVKKEPKGEYELDRRDEYVENMEYCTGQALAIIDKHIGKMAQMGISTNQAFSTILGCLAVQKQKEKMQERISRARSGEML